MGLERREQARFADLLPTAAPGTGGVVEDQLADRATDVLEDGAQAVAQAFAGLTRIGLRIPHVRERERHHQDVQHLHHPGDHRLSLPEINLGHPR